ncbi:TcdA/TcdB pore-forming domain-containing protein [Chromobacterium sp. CV08]|uniref:TcdA/TcdB pore-forming domain-containing protein n=1 Tax=Chromobacterium sp. CV08 TaxID=3133274 RepID=UPI003DA7F685
MPNFTKDEQNEINKLVDQRKRRQEGEAMMKSLGKGLAQIFQEKNLAAKDWVPILGSYNKDDHTLTLLKRGGGKPETMVITPSEEMRNALENLKIMGEEVTREKEEIEGGTTPSIEAPAIIAWASAVDAAVYHGFEGELNEDLSKSLRSAIEIHSYFILAGAAFETLSKTTEIVEVVAELMAGGELGALGESLSMASKLFKGGTVVASAVGVVCDAAEVAFAETNIQRASAATALTFDTISTAMNLTAVLLGETTLGLALGYLAAPLAALGYGIGALVGDVVGLYDGHGKINDYFDMLHNNYQAHGYKLDEKGRMIPLEGVPISVLDLVNKKVTFGKNTFKSDYDHLEWDLHEGFGVNGSRNPDDWYTVSLDEKYNTCNVVVLPFAPNERISLNADPMMVASPSGLIAGMNDKEMMNKDGSFRKIYFSPRQGTAGTYTKMYPEYLKTSTTVMLGKDQSVILVMPDLKHLKGYYSNNSYQMDYYLHGAGGVYTLVPSQYGTATLQGDNSTWLVRVKGFNTAIEYSEAVGKHFIINGCGVWDYGKGNTVLVSQEDDLTWKLDYANHTKTLTLVGNAWIDKNKGNLTSALWTLADHEKVENIPLDYHGFKGVYVKSAGLIIQQRENGVLLFGNELTASKKDDGKLVNPHLGVTQEWVSAHSSSMNTLYAALESLASEHHNDAPGPISVNWKSSKGEQVSGSFMPGTKAITAVDNDGVLIQYEGSLDSSVAIGLTEAWFNKHPGATMESMIDYMKQRGQTGSFKIKGMPRDVNGERLNGHYDAVTHTMSASNSSGIGYAWIDGGWRQSVLNQAWFDQYKGMTLQQLKPYLDKYSTITIKGLQVASGVSIDGVVEFTAGDRMPRIIGSSQDGRTWRKDTLRSGATVTGYGREYFKTPIGKTVHSIADLVRRHEIESGISIVGEKKGQDDYFGFDFDGLIIDGKQYSGHVYDMFRRTVAIDQDGNSYVADGRNGTLQLVASASRPVLTTLISQPEHTALLTQAMSTFVQHGVAGNASEPTLPPPLTQLLSVTQAAFKRA